MNETFFASLAKSDPDGQLVRHVNHTGFLHSSGQLECGDAVHKAGNPYHGAGGKFSSQNNSGASSHDATRFAAKTPGDARAQALAARTHQNAVNSTSSGAQRYQHMTAQSAHQASTAALVTGASDDHDFAMHRHGEAEQAARMNGDKDAAAAHKSIAAFHSTQADTGRVATSNEAMAATHAAGDEQTPEAHDRAAAAHQDAAYATPPGPNEAQADYHSVAGEAHSQSAAALRSDDDDHEHFDAAQSHARAAHMAGELSMQGLAERHHQIQQAHEKAAGMKVHYDPSSDMHPAIGDGRGSALQHSSRSGRAKFGKAANSWDEGSPNDDAALTNTNHNYTGDVHTPSPTQQMPADGGLAHDEVPVDAPATGAYANWLSTGGRTKPSPAFQSSTRRSSTTSAPSR